MPTLYRYKLFISHAWRYSDGYESLVRFLEAAPNFIYANHSIPTDRAFDRMSRPELEEQLREQIRPVNVVLIIGRMYVAHSDWIQFEIDYAKALDKPIIGLFPWGSERMPSAITLAATELIGWSTASIVDGIRRIAR